MRDLLALVRRRDLFVGLASLPFAAVVLSTDAGVAHAAPGGRGVMRLEDARLQGDWRLCPKCQAFWFCGLGANGGVCAAGGIHAEGVQKYFVLL